MAVFEITGIVWSDPTLGLPDRLEYENSEYCKAFCPDCADEWISDAVNELESEHGAKIEEYEEFRLARGFDLLDFNLTPDCFNKP